MWHCKSCGHVQSVSNSICEECGKDLGLYGEVVINPLTPPEKKSKKGGARLAVILIAVVAILAACTAAGVLFLPVRLTGVELTVEELEPESNGRYLLREGDKVDCQVEVFHSGILGSVPEAEVESSDTKIIRVSGSGDEVTLTAVAPGRATVTATAGEESASLRFQVEEPEENPGGSQDPPPDDPPAPPTVAEIYIPSFSAFLADALPDLTEDSALRSDGSALDSTYSGIPEALVQPAVDEYILLLTDQYGLHSAGSYNYTTGGGDCSDYWFTVSQSGADTFTAQAQDGTSLGECSVQISARPGQEQVSISLNRKPSGPVYFEDYGDRASDLPPTATVTNLELKCYELLNDPLRPELKWVPEGYSMGYSVTVTYTGTKTSPFYADVTSSDESVLYVDRSTSTITARSAGTATITAKGYGFTSTQEITVYPVNRSTGCSLTLDTLSIPVGSESSVIPIKAAMKFDDTVSRLRVNMLTATGVARDSAGKWLEDNTRVFNVSVNPDELNTKAQNLVIFYLVQVHSEDDDDYDISTDILDFVVVQRG